MAILAVISFITLLPYLVCGQFCPGQEYTLPAPNYVLNINSPNYPGTYGKGTSCRYRITAPMGQYVSLSCRFEVFPDQCGSESFYVSADGDLNFRNSSRYCSTSNIAIFSVLGSISFMFYSTSFTTQLQGRFSCTALSIERCQCGRSNRRVRISHGEEARPHSYPYMVVLKTMNPLDEIFCGGTIISPIHIVTAGHCMLQNPDPRQIVAYVGAHDLSRPNDSPYGAQYRIKQIRIHPSYQAMGEMVLNDIALLETQQPIKWSLGVGPICLPIRQKNNLFPRQQVDVIGWGTTSFGGPRSSRLLRIELTVLQNEACRQRYNPLIQQQQHLCTSDLHGTGKGSCQFDSGGPVIYFENKQAFLVGVISFGPPCGIEPAIGVNTRITSQIGWLLQYVLGHVCAV